MKAVCCAAALLVLGARDYIFALVVPVIMPSPRQMRGLWRGGVQDSIFQSAGTMATKRRRQSKQNSGTSSAVRISGDNADEAEEEPGQCEGEHICTSSAYYFTRSFIGHPETLWSLS